jgi:hypothetical protein
MQNLLPSCTQASFRSSLLNKGSSDAGLQKLLDEAVDRIKERLFPKASFPTPSARFVHIVHTAEGLTYPILLEASQRIAQRPETVVRALVGASPGEIVRGATLPNVGKIFLSENEWCIETLVHEALHSLSTFAVRTDLNERYRLVIEGLTECLTEHLLSTCFTDIYDSCLKAKQTYCSLTYAYEAKIWCAIADIVGYQTIAPVYFWHGRSDWESLFNEFVLSIRKTGCPRFENILETPGKLAVMARLHQECGRRMGERYGKIYRELSERYDQVV